MVTSGGFFMFGMATGGGGKKQAGKSIALGLGDHLYEFSSIVKALPYEQWTGNVTRRSITGKNFGRAFTDAARNADTIYFNVQGISLKEAYQKGRSGFRYGGSDSNGTETNDLC